MKLAIQNEPAPSQRDISMKRADSTMKAADLQFLHEGYHGDANLKDSSDSQFEDEPSVNEQPKNSENLQMALNHVRKNSNLIEINSVFYSDKNCLELED